MRYCYFAALTLILILCLTPFSQAQKGDYYLTQHIPPADLVDNKNYDMLQDQNGIMWIANRKGIVQYDGVNWLLIPTTSAIFSLAKDQNGNIYGSGRNIIGKLDYDELNKISFNVIALDPDIDDIFTSMAVETGVLFLTENSLHYFDTRSDSLYHYLEDFRPAMNGLFIFKNRHIVSTADGDLYSLSEDFKELTPFTDFDNISNKTGVRWISQYSEGTSLTVIIDNQGNLHILNEKEFKPLIIDDDDYIKSSIPLESKWVTDTLLAISTLMGGVVFLNPTDTSSIKIVNYHTGIPDNQVFAMSSDLDFGVWVAHDYGLTRIAPLMPFRSYGNFPGLEGNILAIIRYGDKLYVGTNLGVYYLDKVADYNEIEYYIRKVSGTYQNSAKETPPTTSNNKASKQNETSRKANNEEEVEEAPEEKGKKGIFNFLKKKKNEDEETAIKTPSQEEGKKAETKVDIDPKQTKRGFLSKIFKGEETQEVTKTEWQKQTKRELLSIRYLFKKIDEISTKTGLFVPAGDVLLSVGLSGIHEIKNETAKLITDIPVRHAYFSEKNNLLFASTFDNDILSFRYEEGSWYPADILEGLNDYVFQIMEQENSIWLVSADSLYRIELESEELVDVDVFQINNPYFEETYAVNHDGSLFFVNSSGYYYYDPIERKILEAEGLKEVWGNAERLFVGGGKNIWMFNGKEWNTLGENDFGEQNYDFLNVFPEIRQLYYSHEKNQFWIVTAQNKIYEINPPKDVPIKTQNSIFLKEIRQQNNILRPEPLLNVQLENSSLTFNFIQPDYSRLLGIEYQYRLIGLSEKWSEWSRSNNVLTFSYLPSGKYRLEFQTRNIFGTISSINPIEFKIIDPYWRRPWFYAVEVLVFGVLLFLSIRLNRYTTRYRVISRLLAFLTLILIIEFIQTVAEYEFETNTSPVIDFFIQVSVAMAVLPFESLLRRAIFKSKAAGALTESLLESEKSKKSKQSKKEK